MLLHCIDHTLSPSFQKQFRINIHPVKQHAPMQMRARHPPAGAGQSEHPAAINAVACFHIDAAHVDVERDEALPVIHEHALAGLKIIVRGNHATRGSGTQRGARTYR